MGPPGNGPHENTSALDAELRGIHWIAGISVVVVVLATGAGTLWLSDRILARQIAETAEDAQRDAKAIAGIVDRTFQELASIPQVLSSNRDLHVIMDRYNALEQGFSRLPDEQRNRRLKNDPQVVRFSQRLTQIRNKLNYDLIYALDSRGVRVVSSDWDHEASLLGTRLDDREYFKEAMTGAEGHQFAVSRTTKVPVFFFSSPIEKETGVAGVVVVRQDIDVVGSLLAGGRHATLIVDSQGMVVATSRREYGLRHVGPMAAARPDADTLRTVYAQERLRPVPIERPARPLHEAEWNLNGHPYLVSKVRLHVSDYHLLFLSPLERSEAVKPLHYLIGALAALLVVLIALQLDRGASNIARRNHHARVTASLNEKLTAADKEKNRFLGIVAHDLRNPLSSMRGLSQMMIEAPLEPEQQREFLDTIYRTSDEMLGLVNDLLDVAVIESGRLALNRTDHDLVKMIQRRIRHLEPHARSKQIAVSVDAPDGQRASIDGPRFNQVVDNLVSNAIKFSPPGSVVRVALQSHDGSFNFSVQDQGPGIPESERKLLYRSFQKLSARPTGGEKSTGLGLAIVKRIVDAHGGRIDVESGPTGGTRFAVTVPLAQGGS